MTDIQAETNPGYHVAALLNTWVCIFQIVDLFSHHKEDVVDNEAEERINKQHQDVPHCSIIAADPTSSSNHV